MESLLQQIEKGLFCGMVQQVQKSVDSLALNKFLFRWLNSHQMGVISLRDGIRDLA